VAEAGSRRRGGRVREGETANRPSWRAQGGGRHGSDVEGRGGVLWLGGVDVEGRAVQQRVGKEAGNALWLR
jgi:hypothetical protein